MNQKKLKREILDVPHVKWHTASALISLLLIFIILLLKDRSLPPVVPLFYGNPADGEQLAEQSFLVLPSAVTLIIATTNATISRLLDDSFVHRVLWGLSLVAVVLSAITTLRIIFLVGRL